MIINRKRNEGMEIDYLGFSIFRYKFWLTKSKYCKPRLVILKMSKNPNIGAEKTWSYAL
jgi:hypothetical protein